MYLFNDDKSKSDLILAKASASGVALSAGAEGAANVALAAGVADVVGIRAIDVWIGSEGTHTPQSRRVEVGSFSFTGQTLVVALYNHNSAAVTVGVTVYYSYVE